MSESDAEFHLERMKRQTTIGREQLTYELETLLSFLKSPYLGELDVHQVLRISEQLHNVQRVLSALIVHTASVNTIKILTEKD